MGHIQLVDMPCGWGKSTIILKSFKKQEKYIAVLPYLSEVDRFVEGAFQESRFILTAPVQGSSTKKDHCEKLIKEGKSIACTHQLFYRLGTLATQPSDTSNAFDGTYISAVADTHLLDDYHLIIDEVIDPFQQENMVRSADFDGDYVELGLATVLPDGRVKPTGLWDQRYAEGSKTFKRDLYEKAKSGALYRLADGLFILTIPMELLLRPKSVTIYSYLSEGSILLQFLRKLKAEGQHEFTLEVTPLDEAAHAAWRSDVASALTVKSILGLEKTKLNYQAQLNNIKKRSECASFGYELVKLRQNELKGVSLKAVMLTCARALWYSSNSGEKPMAGRLAKHARLFGHAQVEQKYCAESETDKNEWTTTGVQFVPNTTRGTNRHSICGHALYLYDQHPNPQLLTFLGMKRNSPEAYAFSDAYALTELVQWLFRSAIRKGGLNGCGGPYRQRESVTVYIPSERMRNLLANWLLTGQVTSRKTKPVQISKTHSGRQQTGVQLAA